MATGKLGVGSKFSQILIGITTANGSALLVLTGSDEGLVLAAVYPLQAPATAFAFGDLNSDTRGDAAIVSGGNLFILDGRALNPATGNSNGLEAVSLPFSVSSIALGSFAFDRNPGLQMELLSPDGNVYLVAHSGFDPRPFTAVEMTAMRLARGRNTQASANRAGGITWSVIETIPAVGVSNNPSTPALLMRTRISSNGSDDILVLNPAASQMVIVSHSNPRHGLATQADGSFAPGATSVRFYGTGTPVAALVMRVNIDARPGLVVLHQGQLAPTVMMPLPDPVFTVNTTTDLVSANPNACLMNVADECSLRQAVIEANATSGVDTIMVPSGTFTLTIPRQEGEHTAHHGHLDILDGVNIVGAGPTDTIIQAGTDQTNGIDKVFSINPDLHTAFDTSFSNLTIRYGRNVNSYSGSRGAGGDDFGGAFDWEATGTGNLYLTNCTIAYNSTVHNDGGGIYATNALPGTPGGVTIILSQLQHNNTSATGESGLGGGLYLGPDTNLAMSGTDISHNESRPAVGNGGGIFIAGPTLGISPPSIVINSASTISNNTAALNGGGIYTNAGLTINQASVIGNNTAGGDGGGLWSNVAGLPALQPVTLSKVSIIGNTAAGSGGGIQVDGLPAPANNFSISFSRFVGNTAAHGSNLNNVAGSVMATNNWWDTNTPATTINGAVTFDPYIVLTHTASPAKLPISQAAVLTADMSKDNHGNPLGITNLDLIVGLPITFNNAALGVISGATTPLDANAQATATYTAGGAGGNGSADATVDHTTVTASITVLQPPSIAKSFNPTAVAVNSPSTVTFSITNGNTVAINASFTDTLPANMRVSASPNLVNNCGGIVTALPGTGDISYTNAASLAAGICTITVDVNGGSDGVLGNSVTINSTDAGNGNSSSANLTVFNLPTILKAFGATTIPANSTTSLTFTLHSPNGHLTLTGVGFTDPLPAGLLVASPNSLLNTCGGTADGADGASIVSLWGASLAPGATCTVTVNVTGTIPGIKNNTTSAIISTETGAGNNSNTATITVVAPPVLSKVFGAATIPLTGSTSLTFTIQNLNVTHALNGIGFIDTLPSGLVISTPNGLSSTCAVGTITATQATNLISLTGAALPPGSCTFSVNVDGILAGQQNNLTSVVTSNEGGLGAAASASVIVVAPPIVKKVFGPYTPPPAGLVGWWTGDGNATDISGNGNNGTLNGAATYGAGLLGQAFSFDAPLNSAVVISSASALNPSDAITIDAWVQPFSFPNSYPTIVRKDQDNLGTTQYAISVSDQGQALCSVGAFAVPVGGAISLNTWAHVACTYDRQYARLYVNGIEVASVAATQPVPSFSI